MSNTSDAVLQSENRIIDNCYRLLLPYYCYCVVFKNETNVKKPICWVDINLQNAVIINRQQEGRSYKPPCVAAERKENLHSTDEEQSAPCSAAQRPTQYTAAESQSKTL